MIKILIYAADDFAPIQEDLRLNSSLSIDDIAVASLADLVLVQDKNDPKFYTVLKNRYGKTGGRVHSYNIGELSIGVENVQVFNKPQLTSIATKVQSKVELEKIKHEEITHPLQRMEV